MEQPRILLASEPGPDMAEALMGMPCEMAADWVPEGPALLLLDLGQLAPEAALGVLADIRSHAHQALPLLLVLPAAAAVPEALLQQPVDLLWRPFTPAELGLRIRLLAERAHQRVAEALRQAAEEGFRQVFEKHHAMMLLINPESGRIVDANPAASRFYGYPREQMRQMRIQQINQLSDTDVDREIGRAKQQVSNYFTFLHRLASGEVRTVEVHSTPVEIDNRELLFSIIHDITQRRKAEEALRRSEEGFRQLFEIAPIGIGVADLGGRLLAFNNAMLTPGGYTRAEIEANSQVAALYYDAGERDRVLAEFRREGFINRREVRFRRKDGRPYEALLTLAPIRFENQPGLLALTEDITERKQAERALQQSEARYRQIVETAEEGIWIIDGASLTTFVNRKMAIMLGYEQPEQLIGKSLFAFMDAEGISISEAHLERRRAGISEVHDFKLLTRAGETLWTSMSTSPLYGEDGAYIGAMAMVTDISARKRSEDRVQQALNEREVLLREIHHRVKNNFQVIISLLNMQSRKLDDARSAAPLTEMRHRIRSMALIHERIYQSESLADVDFAEYVQFLTRELHAPGSGASDVRLSFALEQVLLDIEQAIPCGLLVNELLTNAFKYAFPPEWPGDRLITVQLREQAGQAILQVADSGLGLPAAVDPERPQTLGMQLIRQLVRQLEGSYELGDDKGTVWTIRFPLMRREWGRQ